jgi:cytochrome c biogenesis protein CcmG/thiol:disulfide interchange protein DsbE
MHRFILPFVVFVLLIVVFSFGLFNDPRKLPSPFLGEQAPTFELPSLTEPDHIVSSSDYAGKYALVNVWATWCVGCRQEHAFLLELEHSGAIPIYGLNWRDNRPEALNWLQQLGDPYVFSAFDEDGRVGIDWGVYGAPETFLINADGIVLHKHLGPLTRGIWESDFVPLLQGGVPRS